MGLAFSRPSNGSARGHIVGARMESRGKFQGMAVGKWRTGWGALREGAVDSLRVYPGAISP